MSSLPTTEKFESIYRSLLVADLRRELAPFFPPATFPEDDLAYALSVATRLSLNGGGETEERAIAGRKAYDVAIRALNFANGSTPTVRTICDLILSRIGNFPARLLLAQQAGPARTVDPFLATEMLVRERENKLRGTASETVLTDFQVRLIQALEANASVSVSAPTSAGKSFTLEVELLRRLKDDAAYVAVFLVPTRALIRQVTFDLVQLLRDHDLPNVPVVSAPTVPDAPLVGNKFIYILTQERLATLLTSDAQQLSIHAVIVDEAHEIGESDRGLTLERVLAITLTRFPHVRLFFSSPLRSNPDFLLRLFGRDHDAEHFVEHLSPVSQNIINVEKILGRGKTRSAKLDLVVDNQAAALGIVELPFEFRTGSGYIGKFAFHFTRPGETSIVYCNEPKVADKTAVEIASHIPRR